MHQEITHTKKQPTATFASCMSIGMSSETETYCCFSHSFSLPPDLEVPEFSPEVTKSCFGEPLGRPPCPFTCTWLQLCTRSHYLFFWVHSHVSSPTPPSLSLPFHIILSLHLVPFPHHCRYFYVLTRFAGLSKAWYFFPFSAKFSLSLKSKDASVLPSPCSAMCSYHERLGPVIRFCWLRGSQGVFEKVASPRLITAQCTCSSPSTAFMLMQKIITLI